MVPKKARPHPKPQRDRTFLRAWRKHRELTMAQVIEHLELLPQPILISEGQLSRIERSEQPYSQDLLEGLADIYRCGVPDLIMRDPDDPAGIWSVWDSLEPTQRLQVVEIAKTLRRTGT